MKHVVYLCDRKACIINGTDYCVDNCMLTHKADHAINGFCEDPDNHPERFEKIESRVGPIYKEKEDYTNDEPDEEASK